MKPVREPDAGDPQVRFDERRRETEPRPRLRHRIKAKAAGNSDSLDLQPPAPAADSTVPWSNERSRLRAQSTTSDRTEPFIIRREAVSPSRSLAGGLQEAPDELAVVPDPGVYRLRDERLQLRDQALGLRAAQEAQRPGDSEARSEGAAAPLPFVDRHSADAKIKGELDDRGFSQVEAGQQGG